MTERLTAAEARKLAGPTVDERVDDACDKIRTRAENKNRSAKFTDKFWGSVANTSTPEYRAATSQLVLLGYTVRFVPESGDVGATIVEW